MLVTLMDNCVHTAVRMSKLFVVVNQRNRSSSDDPFQINIFSRNCTPTQGGEINALCWHTGKEWLYETSSSFL